MAAESLEATWDVIFNGNGYSEEWKKEAARRKLYMQNSNVEATETLRTPKNVALFEKLNVMSAEESAARADAMHDQYAGIVEIELQVMIEMIRASILPVIERSPAAGMMKSDLERGVQALEQELHKMERAPTSYAKATAARVARLETMESVRAVCDKTEALVSKADWPFASYQKLLFLDFHQGHTIANRS